MSTEESKKNIEETSKLENAEVDEASQYGDVPSNDSEETRGGLSPQEIERLKAVARKRFIIAFLVGILLATFGFFAGKKARSAHDAAPWSCQEISVALHALDRQPGIVCLQGKPNDLFGEDGNSWKNLSEVREDARVNQREWKL